MQLLRGTSWAIVAILALALPLTSSADEPNMQATLDVKIDPVQPANAPVVMTLTVRNTGNVPIQFWCAGPGDYPDANQFTAIVSPLDVGEPSKRFSLINGQQSDGAVGSVRKIAPGHSASFPAAFEPLDAGKYRLSVMCEAVVDRPDANPSVLTWPAMQTGNVIDFRVSELPDLLVARDAWTIARVRANDPFVKALAVNWPRKPVRDALLEDLMGDNVVAADRAADGIWGEQAPADSDPQVVAKVLKRHANPPKDGYDLGLMEKLLKATKRPKSPDLNRALLQIACGRSEEMIHRQAFTVLDLPDPTTDVFLKPNSYDLRSKEADALVRRQQDAAAVAGIVGLLRSSDPKERKVAVRMLRSFPDSPEALAAVRKAQNDDDRDVAMAADHATYEMEHSPTTLP